jgi:hypothetical protein
MNASTTTAPARRPGLLAIPRIDMAMATPLIATKMESGTACITTTPQPVKASAMANSGMSVIQLEFALRAQPARFQFPSNMSRPCRTAEAVSEEPGQSHDSRFSRKIHAAARTQPVRTPTPSKGMLRTFRRRLGGRASALVLIAGRDLNAWTTFITPAECGRGRGIWDHSPRKPLHSAQARRTQQHQTQRPDRRSRAPPQPIAPVQHAARDLRRFAADLIRSPPPRSVCRMSTIRAP